jgi:PAS domain S-box-containing protein
MFINKKYFCVLDSNFIIKDISTELLEILEYENSDEILNRHLTVILPKYFLFLNHKANLTNRKITALFLSKKGKNIPVRFKLLHKKDEIYIKVRLKRSKTIDILADYQLFFNNINQAASFGIIIFNDQGYVVHVNDAICRMYGYPLYEIIGLHGTAFIHQKNHKEFYRLINDVKNDEKFSTKSIEIRKDGSLFNSYVEGKAIFTKYGKFLVALVFDTTETVEKEEELKFQKEIFKKVFDLSPVGYFIYDENLSVTESNNAFLEQLEIRREDFIGFDINRISNKALFNLIKKSISGEECRYEGYYTSLLSGKTIFSKALFIPIKYKEKKMGIGISLDLTKEKQIENDLLQKKQFYELLVNTALTGIGITDINENFILVNPAFAHMLGYTVDEMMNTPLSNYTTPRQMALFKKQTEIRKQGNPSVYEASLVNKNGNLMHVLIHASPMKNDTGEVIGTLGIVIDLTYQDFLTKQITTLTEKK